jgi:hypothetical protein
MKNKYAIIISTVIIIVLSILLIGYLFNTGYINNMNDINNVNNHTFSNISSYNRDGYMLNNSYIPTSSFIERFSNKKQEKQEDYNNLINNGSFENGNEPNNHINDSGFNKIIMMKNPGKTNYVLHQKITEEQTYYQLSIPNRINTKFVLTFYLCIDKNDIKDLLFDKLIYIKMQNDDYSSYNPRLDYYVTQKTVMSDGNMWYHMKYVFISGPNTTKNMQLYLNYSNKLQFNNYYFASIQLNSVLIDSENFVFNNKLLSYVDGYYYENSGTWHDLGGLGNDLYWSQTPIVDYTKGFANSRNLKLTAFHANKLSNNEFTILFCLSKNTTSNDITDKQINTQFGQEEEEEISEKSIVNESFLLSMPGNDRYSFEIRLDNDYLRLIIDNKEYISKQQLILYNKSLLAITYDGTTMNIYYDGALLISEKIRKIYLNTSPILINKNRNLNYHFYSILFYNRLIHLSELDELRSYFIENKNKKNNNPDINDYLMSSTIDKLKDPTISMIKPYNKKDSKFDTIDDESLKYNDYKENFKPFGEIFNETIAKEISERMICPKVYKKNGNYMVYIPKNSYYASMLNYSGERSYGHDIEKARYTYYRNFPKCAIPEELMYYSNKDSMDTCPYIINEGNPCFTSQCTNVDWNVDHYKQLNLNKNCKKHVSNYCHVNSNVDDKCICWTPQYKNDPKCIEFRRYIEDPNDYCSVDQFNIEEHPDFGKYIRKDNIPCWGCNLTM